MTKVTITIDDAGGKVAVGCEIPGLPATDVAYQLSQRADFFEEEVGLETTTTATGGVNFLDANGQREPQEAKVVHTMDEYRGKRAAMVRDIKPEPVEIFAG